MRNEALLEAVLKQAKTTRPVVNRVFWKHVVRMLQSCSLSQDRKNLLHRPKNSRCSVNPESESRADSFPAAQTFRQFSICLALSVSSRQILCNSSISLQLSCASFLEPDLPIDSPDAAPIFEIQVFDGFQRGQYQHFFVPIFLCLTGNVG